MCRRRHEHVCRYALAGLQWIGVHYHMLETDCDPGDWQALSKLDERKLERLLKNDERLPADWRGELEEMLQGGYKCEIEAAHKLRGMHAFCAMLVESMSMYSGL